MARIISFEGCIGAGKSSLTSYFSHELGLPKVLEQYDRNPFLEDFYAGKDVKLETEITFLLQHYSQLKGVTQDSSKAWVLADFSIEKDLVYARLNLEETELKLFEALYDYVIDKIGIPDVVIYIDLSLDALRTRINQRGRAYEMPVDERYFGEVNESLKRFFQDESDSRVFVYEADDLTLDRRDDKLLSMSRLILNIIG